MVAADQPAVLGGLHSRSAGGCPGRAGTPDALPHHERRLDAEIAEQYGPGRPLAEIAEAWRPYRTWAAVHLRVLREHRTGEIAGRRPAQVRPGASATVP